MRYVLPILLCASAVLIAQQPRRAPGWALPDAKMKIYDLADFRGKVVVLEFMQTDCPHCAAFADILHQAEQKYGPKIQIVSVVHAQHDNASTVSSYVTGHRVDYPVLLDAGQMMYSYVLDAHLEFPRVFVIDANGMIRYDYKNDITTRDVFEGNGLSQAIDKVLGDKGGKK
jgi:thiol-disulfide isomerase/thioredoxin